jgi:hypothetical protein
MFPGTLLLGFCSNIEMYNAPDDVRILAFDKFVGTRHRLHMLRETLNLSEVRIVKPLHILTLLPYSWSKICNIRVSVKVEKQLLFLPIDTARLQCS